jgi:hypothetical protein
MDVEKDTDASEQRYLYEIERRTPPKDRHEAFMRAFYLNLLDSHKKLRSLEQAKG